MKTKIYELIGQRPNHPLFGQPRYVGKTIRPLRIRLQGHLCNAKNHIYENNYRQHWLRKCINSNSIPKINLIIEVTRT